MRLNKPYTDEQYAELAIYCNSNGLIIEDKGEYFESSQIKFPISELKDTKLKEIDNWTAKAIVSGFVSDCNGKQIKYDSDKETQLTMQGIAINVNTELFATEYPNGCPVRGYEENSEEKSIQWLTPVQVLLWLAHLYKYIGFCKQRGWTLQEAVNNISNTDPEAKNKLDAITW